MKPLSLLIGAFQTSNLHLFSATSASDGSINTSQTVKEPGWVGRISSSVVYAVGHTNPGSLATFKIANGSLSPISSVSTQANGPAHAGVVGKLLIAANYVRPDPRTKLSSRAVATASPSSSILMAV